MWRDAAGTRTYRRVPYHISSGVEENRSEFRGFETDSPDHSAAKNQEEPQKWLPR